MGELTKEDRTIKTLITGNARFLNIEIIPLKFLILITATLSQPDRF